MKHDAYMIGFADRDTSIRDMLARECVTVRREAFDPHLIEAGERPVVFLAWQGENVSEERVRGVRSACGFRDVPIVVCCSTAERQAAVKSLEYGADHVLAGDAPEEMAKAGELVRTLSAERSMVNEDDVPYARAFVQSVYDVLATMSGLEVVLKHMYLTESHYLLGEVKGVMKVAGAAEGFIAIGLDERTARRVVAGLLGQDLVAMSVSDVSDGAYEAINMIAGGAKAKLSGGPYHFEMSTPFVLRGTTECRRYADVAAPCLVLIFDLAGELFALHVCLLARADEDVVAGGSD